MERTTALLGVNVIVEVSIRRLPRGRCPYCRRRRVLLVLAVGTTTQPPTTTFGRCHECWGIIAEVIEAIHSPQEAT